MRTLTWCAAALAMLAFSAGGASAGGPTILNFEGFLYESNNASNTVGYPPSDPGDELAGCGLITGISAPLSWSTDEYLYTWSVQGLISVGEVDLGYDMLQIDYVGGSIDIFADRYAAPSYTPPEYGIEPPNDTVPANFRDGNLYLHGVFTTFTMYYFPSQHTGQYEGLVNFQLGSNLGDLQDPGGYVFAGTTDRYAAIVTPQGYDFEAVGHINFNTAIPVETSTWGGVKNLYR